MKRKISLREIKRFEKDGRLLPDELEKLIFKKDKKGLIELENNITIILSEYKNAYKIIRDAIEPYVDFVKQYTTYFIFQDKVKNCIKELEEKK